MNTLQNLPKLFPRSFRHAFAVAIKTIHTTCLLHNVQNAESSPLEFSGNGEEKSRTDKATALNPRDCTSDGKQPGLESVDKRRVLHEMYFGLVLRLSIARHDKRDRDACTLEDDNST
ncbi:hypothetical protein Hypma_006678 [Hypsizygus marmoreus]|uniref:Uncharacterized protein n=1 Tax=Hypsizygus marmoreus TaxID=39966 RepID=A0A369K0A3_HYPMA|nr:hypothetical protein Hypma_006678 [Hypsizygus marmoreus]